MSEAIIMSEPEPDAIRIEATDTILKVGCFEANVGPNGKGYVMLDGQKIMCHGFDVKAEVGKLAEITVRVAPVTRPPYMKPKDGE